MSALRDLQAAWGAALLGGPVEPALANIAPDGLAPAARLAVYRHHVRTSLTGVLEDIYPAVRRLVHPHFFAYAADRFITTCPPAGPVLSEYGGALPDFLAAFEPCRHLAYLADVARLEWAVHRASYAADAAALDPRPLTRIPPDARAEVRMRFHPSLTLLDSPWPVDAIWRANRTVSDAGGSVHLDTGPAHLEVRRRGADVVVRSLAPGAYALRRTLHDAGTLGEAADAARAVDPALDLTAALAALFGDEVLVAFTPGIRKEQS